jgi:hypothetical protein
MEEKNQYQSKTTEMMNEKKESLTENKFATFTQDLTNDLAQIQEKKDTNQKLNQEERYNDPIKDKEKKEEKKNPLFKLLENLCLYSNKLNQKQFKTHNQ